MSAPKGPDPYKNAKKEMEMLLKLEGGVTPSGSNKGMYDKNELAASLRGSGGRTPSPGGGSSSMSNAMIPMLASDAEFQVATDFNPQDMIRQLTEKAGLRFEDIQNFAITEDGIEKLRSYIPSTIARERRVFPLGEQERPGSRPLLTIAIADPLDIRIVDDLRLMLPEHDIEPVVIAEQDIIDAIDRWYGVGEESIEDVVEALVAGEGGSAEGGRAGEVELDLEKLANDPPIIKLVNLLLVQAIQDRASDLHIEPFASNMRIRYRVDGVLREIPSPPKSMQMGLISRLKVMAGLNISETRVPQDGRIRLNISGREVDLRVAAAPTVHGESIVMRILDKSAMMIGVSQLGLQKEPLEELLKLAKKPNGIILVTGPTGCGKTTSLYSVLNEVYDPGAKFITTEDPVEYELPGIVQVNINVKVHLTFAACLRSILRQDPDVILVGEIRDVETAQIAIQAALTGHLVLSTLHTNSAAATVTRLVDMGIEPFLLTSTLQGIIGQRLIRTVCPMCRVPYIPTDEELDDFGMHREDVEDIIFYQGRGCDNCNFSGYKGRLGIFELLIVTEEIQELILSRATTDEIHALAVHQGMQTMRSDGWLKICLGLTTFEEISRQTPRETAESAEMERSSAKKSLAKIEQVRREREAEDKDAERGDDDGGGTPFVDEAAKPIE